jgi:pimeloyl-ACP methyl ester carboxylesterase
VHYERRGDGPPLLLVQGMGANSLHRGEPFLTALERDFELVLYDHRGARLELLEGVGHLFFWEQPQRTAQLVREFALRAAVPSG